MYMIKYDLSMRHKQVVCCTKFSKAAGVLAIFFLATLNILWVRLQNWSTSTELAEVLATTWIKGWQDRWRHWVLNNCAMRTNDEGIRSRQMYLLVSILSSYIWVCITLSCRKARDSVERERWEWVGPLGKWCEEAYGWVPTRYYLGTWALWYLALRYWTLEYLGVYRWIVPLQKKKGASLTGREGTRRSVGIGGTIREAMRAACSLPSGHPHISTVFSTTYPSKYHFYILLRLSG